MKTLNEQNRMNSSPYRHLASLSLLSVLLLAACSDWENAITPPDPQTPEAPIAFSGSVVAMPSDGTRADSSLVDIHETSLRPTSESGYSVGIFGCYTGQYQWSELAEKDILTDDEADAYTANLFYNQKADVSAPAKGIDTLVYSPQRFWPNNRLGGGNTQHEYVTLWAYYPYNPTTNGMGQNGITMNINKGEGMGRMAFTTNTDALQQVDFMMSLPVIDCNKDKYPLVSNDVNDFTPKPVPFRFYHMLSQVRVYAAINAADILEYEKDEYGNDSVADAKWFEKWEVGDTIFDAYGNTYTKIAQQTETTEGEMTEYKVERKADHQILTAEEFLALRLKVPAAEGTHQRWTRGDDWDKVHQCRRARLKYELSFNNIMTSTEFEYRTNANGMIVPDAVPEKTSTMGFATVSDYKVNPKWFKYTAGKPVLDDDYMFATKDDNADKDSRYVNFARENILLMVPQELKDDNVPHIILKITDKENSQLSAQVTINLLKMNITWKSGYVYCYAFTDELRPGDDKVQGPESITVVVDSSQFTDQW